MTPESNAIISAMVQGASPAQAFDWARYAVGGAAARSDSFSGLQPDYAANVQRMLQAADQELGPGALKITSAYRSPEVQARLFASAVQRYGSEAAARRWVAPPGRSMHNRGLAVDFAGPNGGLLRDANSREAQWLASNAGRFGLGVPMDWEPWQVEPLDGRSRPASNSGGGSANGSYTASNGSSSTYSAPPSYGMAFASQEQQGYPQQPGQQNALAAQEQEQPRFNMLDMRQDPRAFMMQSPMMGPAPVVNQLAPMQYQRPTYNTARG